MITNGVITFEDGRKGAEEYVPPKKAKAEIHFLVPEGGDEEVVMNRARFYATAQVAAMLTGVSSVIPVREASPAKADAPMEPAATEEPAKEPARRGRPKKDKLPDVTGPFPEAPTAASGQAETSEGQPAEVPTTQRLIEIVKETAAAYKGKAPEITALIKQFCPGEAPALTRVPDNRRLDFLAALDAAKKTWTKTEE